MDLNVVKQWLDLGWPTILLLLTAYGVRRLCVWAKPFIEAAFAAHIETVKTVGDTQQKMSGTLETLASNQEQISTTQDQLKDLFAGMECGKKIGMIHDNVAHIRNRVDSWDGKPRTV